MVLSDPVILWDPIILTIIAHAHYQRMLVVGMLYWLWYWESECASFMLYSLLGWEQVFEELAAFTLVCDRQSGTPGHPLYSVSPLPHLKSDAES